VVWEEIIIYLPVRIPILMLSATIGNPEQISNWLSSIRGKPCTIVENKNRPVPLYPLFVHPSGTLFPFLQGDAKNSRLHKKVFKYNTGKRRSGFDSKGKLPPFGDILEILDRYNLLPAIFFLKSRKECDHAVRLCNSNLINRNPARREKLIETIDELVSDNTHLKNHKQRHYLEHTGTAAHHSGHLPAWKVVVETLMAKGLLDAMFATSTVAAGVNFPARSVVVLNSDRFNGVEFMPLSPSEFQQMSGRAGRRGKDKIGFCIILPGKYMDLTYVSNLVHAPAVDIDSQININFSMVLNLLLSHTPLQIKDLLEKSFASFQIAAGKKRGKKARKRFGPGLERLWVDFLDHMEFLIDENFVTADGKLTEDGIWASNLRMDAPLLVAQALRDNLMPQQDPALIAAIMAAFVNEKEFKDDPLFHQALPKQLKDNFLSVRQGLKPFALRLLKNDFDAPNLFIQPSLILYKWAHGEPWDEITMQSEFAEGDLARLILRTGENLRQLARLNLVFPDTAESAKKAIELIFREPVITTF
jgi:ATP-dependent RNA helicase HelY